MLAELITIYVYKNVRWPDLDKPKVTLAIPHIKKYDTSDINTILVGVDIRSTIIRITSKGENGNKLSYIYMSIFKILGNVKVASLPLFYSIW